MCFSAGRAFDFSCIEVRRRDRSTSKSPESSRVDRDCWKGTSVWFAGLESGKQNYPTRRKYLNDWAGITKVIILSPTDKTALTLSKPLPAFLFSSPWLATKKSMIRSMKLLLSISAIVYRFVQPFPSHKGLLMLLLLTPTIYQKGFPDFQSASTKMRVEFNKRNQKVYRHLTPVVHMMACISIKSIEVQP